MSKKSHIILLLMVITTSVGAQRLLVPKFTVFDDQKIHFGFTLGINTLDFGYKHYTTVDQNPKFDPDKMPPQQRNQIISELEDVSYIVRSDVAELTPGFTVGIVSNLRLSEYLDLRFQPGLSFGSRKMEYNVPIFDYNSNGYIDFYRVRSTFLDFPLVVKYKSKRLINQRPYLIGGLCYKIDIAKTAKEDLIRLKNSNFYAEIGMGWDTYLDWFRFSTELKLSLGLNNVLDSEPKSPQPTHYNYAIERLTSNVVTLSFHFE